MRRTIARSLCLLATASALVACAVPGVAATNLVHRDAKGANAPGFVRAGSVGIIGPAGSTEVFTMDEEDRHTGPRSDYWSGTQEIGVRYVPSGADRGTYWVHAMKFKYFISYGLDVSYKVDPLLDALHNVHAAVAYQAEMNGQVMASVPNKLALAHLTGPISVALPGVSIAVPLSTGDDAGAYVPVTDTKELDGIEQHQPAGSKDTVFEQSVTVVGGYDIDSGWNSFAKATLDVNVFAVPTTMTGVGFPCDQVQYPAWQCFTMAPDP